MSTGLRPNTNSAQADGSNGIINRIGPDAEVDVRLGAHHRREIWGEMRISAAPATVLAFLTDARQMMSWLAQSAKADARPGGIFRLADLNGLWVEGTYVEAIPHQGVVFTWGGIGGREQPAGRHDTAQPS